MTVGALVSVGLAAVLAVCETPNGHWRFWRRWSRTAVALGFLGILGAYALTSLVGWAVLSHYEPTLAKQHALWAGVGAFALGQTLARCSAAPVRPEGNDEALSLLRIAKQWLVENFDDLAQTNIFGEISAAEAGQVANLAASILETHVNPSALDSELKKQTALRLRDVLTEVADGRTGSRGSLDGFCTKLMRQWRVAYGPAAYSP